MVQDKEAIQVFPELEEYYIQAPEPIDDEVLFLDNSHLRLSTFVARAQF